MQSYLFAEILEVKLNWNPLLCDKQTADIFKKELEKVKGIEKLNIDVKGGSAVLNYEKTASFDYLAIDRASRLTGSRIRDVELKIKGSVSFQNNKYYLIVEGSNQQFEILSPKQKTQNTYVANGNISSYILSEEQQIKLKEIQDTNKTVTFKGVLFMPNSGVLQLIVSEGL